VLISYNKPTRHTNLSNFLFWNETPDDGQRNFPNHVAFHSKIKILKN